ncbi:MAG: helix-turn-helix domain-containing protein [Rhizomicrobium sp.]
MRIQSIPLSWARRHCANAVAEGVSLDHLFDMALIEPRFGDDRDRISSAQLALFYYHTNLSTDDEARRNSRGRIPVGLGTVAIRAMFGCSTLESAIGAVAHLYDLASTTMKVRLTVDYDEAVLAVHCEDGQSGSDSTSLEDAYLSFLFMCVNHFIGKILPLSAVETRDPTHMNLGRTHWAAGAPVRLGSLSALRFPKAVLLAPRMANGTDDLFCDVFREWLAFVEPAAVAAIAPKHSMRDFRARQLAQAAGISQATLRRRMDRFDGGLRQAREKALVSAGLDLLLNTADSVDAVAARIGYSDARSFRRFIKSATGRTPLEWRMEHASADILRPNPAVHRRIQAFAKAMCV